MFLASYQILGLDKNIGVSFSLLFFLVTAFVPFTGAFLHDKPPVKEDVIIKEKNKIAKSS